jgi:hypothetical protein
VVHGCGLQAASKIFLPFEQARKLVREVALTSKEGWVQWCSAGNRPKDVPSHPEKVMKLHETT